MTTIQACILGMIQGIAEFLPISSSSHLTLARALLHVEANEYGVFFDLSCHLGTLCALLYFLREDFRLLFKERRDRLLQICIALVPLIPAYYFLQPVRDAMTSPSWIGLTLMGTAILLFLGESFRISRQPLISWKRRTHDALLIGLFQSSALIPGISRSASTISCARILGWSAREAVRFSFLLSIPTILGANFLTFLKISTTSSLPISLSSCLIGFGAALVAGLVVIKPAFRFLERGQLKSCAWYCLILGAVLSMGWFAGFGL